MFPESYSALSLCFWGNACSLGFVERERQLQKQKRHMGEVSWIPRHLWPGVSPRSIQPMELGCWARDPTSFGSVELLTTPLLWKLKLHYAWALVFHRGRKMKQAGLRAIHPKHLLWVPHLERHYHYTVWLHRGHEGTVPITPFLKVKIATTSLIRQYLCTCGCISTLCINQDPDLCVQGMADPWASGGLWQPLANLRPRKPFLL